MSFPQFVIDWFSILPNNLRFIHISDCHNCQHLPSFGSLSSLESLELRGLDTLEFIEIGQGISCSSAEGYFPSLKYLILVKLPHLKGWSKVEDNDADCQQEKHGKEQYAPQKIFSCLFGIKVSGCPNLMSMPLVPGLKTLEAVDIHEKLLKHLISTQVSPVSSSSASSASPALKELHINSIRVSLDYYNFFAGINYNRMQRIDQCACGIFKHSKTTKNPIMPQIERYFVCIILLNLSVLKELEIESCEDLDWADMMDYIEENGDDNVGAISQGVDKLRSLIVTNISKPQALPRGLSYLNALKELSLYWLYNLTVLPESIKHLTQLSRLVICNYPSILNSDSMYISNKFTVESHELMLISFTLFLFSGFLILFW